MKDFFGLKDKVALVTGAAQGIGYGVAKALLANRVRLALADVNKQRLDRVFQAEGEMLKDALAVVMDVSNSKEVDNGINKIIKHFGSIDILINNAGIIKDTLVIRMKEEDWDRVLDINLKGAFLCSKVAAKSMIKSRWGRIVNISSVVGQMGNPGQANYSAAKAGLIGLTKTLAKELAPRGITVNSIAPGYIETQMTNALGDKKKRDMLNLIPLGRFGQIEDIAFMAVVLASESAGYITGQVIPINGGIYM